MNQQWCRKQGGYVKSGKKVSGRMQRMKPERKTSRQLTNIGIGIFQENEMRNISIWELCPEKTLTGIGRKLEGSI
jgi:hypothetical protein